MPFVFPGSTAAPRPGLVTGAAVVTPWSPLVATSGHDAAAARALTIFSCLWAFAALFHQSAYPELIVGRSALLVTLPALWLLLRPSSLPRLLAMVALQVLQVSWNGPAHASNHWLFAYAVNLAFLLAFAWLALARRGRIGTVSRGALLRAVVPVVRVELAILYGFAVLHKLNADFLNPTVSCASTQYAQIAALYPMLPQAPWVDHAVIYGTLVVEALIPVLLFVRRTRLLGVMLGALFHFILTLNPARVFFDFTSVLVAVYFLFLPYDYWTAARARPLRWPMLQRLRERTGARRVVRMGRTLLVALALLLVAAYLLRLTPNEPSAWKMMREGVRILWVLYFVGLLAPFVRVIRHTDVVAATRRFERTTLPWAVAAVVPALLVLNGLTPYLGYKTEASFAMFSNLRTEGGVSNHLFLSQALKIAGYQEDLVRVHASSDRTLARTAARGQSLVWHEFASRTRRLDGRTSVTYTRAGVTHVLPDLGEVPELDDGPRAISRRLLRFRAVERLDRPMPCRH